MVHFLSQEPVSAVDQMLTMAFIDGVKVETDVPHLPQELHQGDGTGLGKPMVIVSLKEGFGVERWILFLIYIFPGDSGEPGEVMTDLLSTNATMLHSVQHHAFTGLAFTVFLFVG